MSTKPGPGNHGVSPGGHAGKASTSSIRQRISAQHPYRSTPSSRRHHTSSTQASACPLRPIRDTLTVYYRERRGVCHERGTSALWQYRSRRCSTRRPRIPRESFYGVVHPRTRTVYVNDPTNIMGVGARLDHILAEERRRRTATRADDRHGVPDADKSSTEKTEWW